MKIFLAGATGALGRRLVPQLVAAGHEVVGTTRTKAKAHSLGELGAEAVVLDVLDEVSTSEAVSRARSEVVVHEATALAGLTDLRKFDEQFADTIRLRTEGTVNLLAAARGAGARRFVAQSFAGWPYAREGGPVKTEDDPLDPHPASAMSRTLESQRRIESLTLGAEGIEGLVLRYGGFYGPGTSLGAGGAYVEAVRSRKFPIVGSGAGVWSFVHIDDAAAATVAAVERGRPGVYNVVDDDPAPVAEWLPALAAAVGAKPPRHVPTWLGRLLGGEPTVLVMTDIRGASNAKAKRELGWAPAHPSWRSGFGELASDLRRAA